MRNLSFDSLFEQYKMRRPLSASRLRQYDVVSGIVHRYEEFRRQEAGQGAYSFDVAAVTPGELERLRLFLRHEGGRPARSENYLRGLLVILKGFFGWCEEHGVRTRRPFAHFVMPREAYGTPVILTLGEVQRLYGARMPSQRLREQRDIFVFQCQVGCRASDLFRLTRGSVQGDTLSYIASKTSGYDGRTVSVPLNATARGIVARYAAGRPADASASSRAAEPLLPFCSLEAYNRAVREAFAAAGLTRPVAVLDPKTRREVRRPLNELAGSHLARRTFVGNLYRQVQDPALISSMSGHAEGSRAFLRYREVDMAMKRDLVRRLEVPGPGR